MEIMKQQESRRMFIFIIQFFLICTSDFFVLNPRTFHTGNRKIHVVDITVP